MISTRQRAAALDRPITRQLLRLFFRLGLLSATLNNRARSSAASSQLRRAAEGSKSQYVTVSREEKIHTLESFRKEIRLKRDTRLLEGPAQP